MEGLEYFAGVDWGSETHHVCIVDGEGAIMGERAFRHGGADLAEMADWLVATANAEAYPIGVAIEIPHGPVVETLMERGFAVHSLNPKQLDRFRDRFSPAGAKDNRRDAHTLGDALRTDRHAFRRLDPTAPEIVELREWSLTAPFRRPSVRPTGRRAGIGHRQPEPPLGVYRTLAASAGQFVSRRHRVTSQCDCSCSPSIFGLAPLLRAVDHGSHHD